MLRLVLPKGSLEKATMELFATPTWPWSGAPTSTTGRPSTTPGSTRSASCGPRRSPSTWPTGCSIWASPAGTGSRRRRRGGLPRELAYSKATASPIRVVLAVAARLPGRIRSRICPAGRRVSTEYPDLTRRLLEKHGVEAEIRLSYGATEAKIPEIADAVVEITETGRALRAAGLRIVGTILESPRS